MFSKPQEWWGKVGWIVCLPPKGDRAFGKSDDIPVA